MEEIAAARMNAVIVEHEALRDWKLSILRIVNKRISFYCQNTNLLPPKPKTSLCHLKLGIQ